MSDNRNIVAIDRSGERLEWTQQGLSGSIEEAVTYLDQLKNQLTGDYAQNISEDPRQARMDTAIAVLKMVEDEGWNHPKAAPVISSVGTALHLLLGSKTDDTVVVNLGKRLVTLE